MRFIECPNLKLRETDWKTCSGVEYLRISNINMSLQKNTPKDLFYVLKNLLHFEFTSSNLTDDDWWMLPEGLKYYSASYNNYRYLDLSNCTNLSYIDIRYNDFIRLPLLSNPVPPIKGLVLSNNPMNSLTVEDLIRFCELTILHLNVPKSSSLSTLQGACQCYTIYKLFEQLNLAGGVRGCYSLSEWVNSACSCRIYRALF